MGKSKVTRSASKPSDSNPTLPFAASPEEAPPRSPHNRTPEPSDAAAQAGKPPSNGQGTIDVAQTVKELVRLAQEQGYLTYNDINEALPETPVSPDQLDDIYIKLRGLEVEIVDQAEVDRVKQPGGEEEDEKGRLDILDDPVRMYLKQMGQVPLLTREQEVEISKRIEAAEEEVKSIIYSFGFAAKEHIALAEKLLSVPPKERFDRLVLDKKIETRQKHLKALRKLMRVVRALDRKVDEKYAAWQAFAPGAKKDRQYARLQKLDHKLQRTFDEFYYKQKVTEEMALVAENVRDKILASQCLIEEFEEQGQPHSQAAIDAERRKMEALEKFVRMPSADYLKACERLKHFATASGAGQDRDGGGQPAPGHLHRQEIHQPRALLPGPDSGGQHRADEGGREVRIPPRLQVLHLRHLVDSPGDHAFHCRPGPHHPHPGAHDRNHQQAHARAEAPDPGSGTRALAGGNRR